MPIVPDTKNWTWVLERQCPECGFDASVVAYRDVPRLTRDNVEAWAEVLKGSKLQQRPDDATWSPLEYAAHVRDVFRIMHARLNLMLVLDDPAFANWDQDETSEAQHYNEQNAADVSRELRAAGEAIAAGFELVRDEELARTGVRGDGSRFTVETLAQYFIHDPIHHLWDVTGRG